MDRFATDRRRLLGAGMVLAGAGAFANGPAAAQAAPVSSTGWSPAMEPQDSWLDKPGARHRMVWDSVSGEGGMEALAYANNFIHINESDYGVTPDQLAVVIIFRHMSTPFGYNPAVWAKYGKGFAEKMKLKDEVAKRAATTNPVLDRMPPGEALSQELEWLNHNSLTDLASKGVKFAVCGLATKAIAGMLAGKTGNAAAIEAELRANLVPGALIVPAGISTVNRAQEHGYSFTYTG